MRLKTVRALTTVALVLNFSFASALSQTALTAQTAQTVTPSWSPPAPRNAKTPFAAKPVRGHDIFRGDANLWLAQAIETQEGGIFDPINDKEITDYVSAVGRHVAKYSAAPQKEFQFIVTSDWSATAMTAGGGKIYISCGMLEQLESEDELAAILSHEIAHDAFHHAARAVTRQMFWLTGTRKIKTAAEAEAALKELNEQLDENQFAALTDRLLGFARIDELEADRAGFYNTYQAGYNPHALASSLKSLEQMRTENSEERTWQLKLFLLLFASHPPTAQRTFALAWESNFVKMPAKNARYSSAAFDAMKQRIKALAE